MLALLVNKSSWKKTDILKICKMLQNFKEKFPDFAVKKFS